MSWLYIKIEKKIMESYSFRELLKKSKFQKLKPEANIPEYNCITNAKVDFIKYTIEKNLVKFNPSVKIFIL